MTEKTKLNRRDAIKVLGAAAGGSVLANIPAKWSKPELSGSVLPAHAQTSCYSVFLEILSTDGGFDGVTVTGPNPDVVTGDGGAGSTVAWYCQTGCLYFFFDLISGTTGQVRITTLAGTFIENYPPNFHDIVIELDTGAYDSTIESGGTAGSCSTNGRPFMERSTTGRSGSWWGK